MKNKQTDQKQTICSENKLLSVLGKKKWNLKLV